MSVLLKSALEEAVEMLPSKLRPEGVLPAIKKAGVKDEELKLSGVLSELPNALKGLPTDEKGRIETGVLKGGYVNAIRTDKFDINEKGFEEGMGNPGYANIVPANVNVSEKNYRERVYRFSAANPVKNASSHFPESDYLMHTRVWDDLIGDADTRVIGEIQSDLHQKDKSLPTRRLDDSTLKSMTTFLTAAGPRVDEQTAFILKNAFNGVETGLTEEQQAEGVAKLMELAKNGASSNDIDKVVKQLYSPAKKDAAWETSWARKGLENEILQAIKDGKQQIAIPIRNSTPTSGGADAVKAALDLALARIPNIADAGNIDELISVSDDIVQALPSSFTAPGSVSRYALKLVNDLVDNKRDETVIKEAFGKLAELHAVPSSLMPALDEAIERIAVLTDDSYDHEFRASIEAVLETLPQALRHHDADDVREAISDMVYSRQRPAEVISTFATLANGTPSITSRPLDTMYRSEGVQKWYETYIDPLSEKLAKQMGVESRVVSKGGVDYRVIDLAKNPKADFKLYSAGGGLAMYLAYKQGYSEDEVTQYMLEQGFGTDEIEKAKADQADIAAKVQAAEAEGYSEDEIVQFMKDGGMPESPASVVDKQADKVDLAKLPPSNEANDAAIAAVANAAEDMTADELVSHLQVIAPNMSSVTTRIAAFFGNDDAVIKAQAAEEAAIAKITELGAKQGLNLSFDGQDWWVDVNGEPMPAEPGILQGIIAEKGEFVGGVGGAIAGFNLAPPNPYAKAAGALLGGVAGATAGTQLDYLYSSMKLQEEMSASIAAHKALTASEAAAYGEIVGVGLFKGGQLLYKGAVRAKDYLLNGNLEGARKALRETMFLTDQEVDEIVAKFSSQVDTSKMSPGQKEILAVTATKPGAEDLVKAAAVIDSQASRAVIKNIDDRAKQIQALVKSDAPIDVGRTLRQDLQAYEQATRDFYDQVKAKAVSSKRAQYYKFNFDKVAIMPVLEKLSENITNPATLDQFMLQLNKARKHTEGRTFGDLIELRQLVNEFKYNKRITRSKDFEAINSVLESIDQRVEAGAKFIMQNPKEWLDEFATARLKYAEMKTLQKNALYKVINRKGVTSQEISSALLKHSISIDGTYEQLIGALPKQMREAAENDMIQQLTTKYSVGEQGGIQAIQLPMLADDLSKRSFVTDSARQMREAIVQLGDVFKNDIKLAQNTGMVRVPEFQSYLTADPLVRAKFEIASNVFNWIKQNIPGSKESRQIALIRNTAKFLETPLNAKAVGELREAAKDVVGIEDAILNVQRQHGEAIAAQMDPNGVTVDLFGSGNVLSTAGKGEAAMRVPAHRIASLDVVKKIADTEGLTLDSGAMLDAALKKYGYKAAQYGSDKVRLLK